MNLSRREFLRAAGLAGAALPLAARLFAAPAEPAEPFLVAQVCDPQLGMTEFRHDVSCFQQTVKQLNLLNPDLVFICGDMLHRADGEAFTLFIDTRAALNPKAICCPGNHDVEQAPTPRTLSAYHKLYGADYMSFTHKGCRFIVANTQLWKSEVTGASAKHDAWFADELEEASGPIFLIGHYPPFVKDPDEGETYHNLPPRTRGPLLQRMRKHGVTAMLTGHLHRTVINDYHGIPIVSGASTCSNIDKSPLGFRIWQIGSAPPQHRHVQIYPRAVLMPVPLPGTARDDEASVACRMNLRRIDTAKEHIGMEKDLPAGSAVTNEDLAAYGITGLSCPAGGTYAPGTLGTDPVCSVEHHRLPYFFHQEEFERRCLEQSILRKREVRLFGE